MPVTPTMQIERGDLLSLVGAKRDVDRAVAVIGYADWPSSATDMVFVGTGIVLGGLVGLLTVNVAGLPITLTASGGALIMGLVFGWLRSVFPAFGRIPEAAMWVFDMVGLSVFIGVVGLTAGPSFISGLQKSGHQPGLRWSRGSLAAAHRGDSLRSICLEDESTYSLGRLLRGRHDDRRAARDPGRGAKQAARVGLHRALRGRQHCAHGLGSGDRRLDVGGELKPWAQLL